MRLKAFTLVEMLLVLVLSTIVIAIAYMVFAQFKLFGYEFEKRSSDSAEFLSFDQHLRHDIHAASDLQGNHTTFKLLDENETALAQYKINAAGIRRSAQNVSDNFNILIQNLWLETNPSNKTILIVIGPEQSLGDTFRYALQLPATAKAPKINSEVVRNSH